MGKTALILGSLVLVGGGLAYWYRNRIPKIVVLSKDNLKNTAVLQIGNKRVSYKYDKEMAMRVPNVGPLYDADISANKNVSEFVTVKILDKKGRIKSTHSIDFS